MNKSTIRPVAAEAIGTGLLLFVVVASGITAERSTNDSALQLVLHAVAVGGGLAVLIAMSRAYPAHNSTRRSPSVSGEARRSTLPRHLPTRSLR